MSLYRDVCEEISSSGMTKELYRFQGAKTASRMDIGGEYIYFSGSIDHHMYFTIKRIKQLLTLELSKEGIVFNQKSLRNPEIYSKIKKIVLYTGNIGNLHSYRLVCSKDIEDLLRQNFVYTDCKPENGKYIERVDRRVYGGGYGVAAEWRKLLNYLTFFQANQKISRQDLLTVLQQMKMSGRMNRKENIGFLLKPKAKYSYGVNANFLNDFNKYNIINALGEIREKGLILPDSSLARNPDKTIREIIENYEESREKTLILLGRRKY